VSRVATVARSRENARKNLSDFTACSSAGVAAAGIRGANGTRRIACRLFAPREDHGDRGVSFPFVMHHQENRRVPHTPTFRPRNRAFASLVSFVALAGAALHAAETPPPITNPFDALAKGKFGGALRYRYEIYDQDTVPGATTVAGGRIDDTAVASTLRLLLSFETASFHGLTGYVDVEGVYPIGREDHYRIVNHPVQGSLPYAIIADPTGTEVNQAMLKWTVPETKLQFIAGREIFALNNGRFISFSGWRQNNQSIDLVRVTAPLGGGFTAGAGWMEEVHRVIGPDPTDGDLKMDSPVANLNFARPGKLNASLYGIWLDYDRADQSSNDTASVGLRLWGPYKVSDTWSVLYTADYAHQSDYGSNPLSVSLEYWLFELGFDRKGQKLFAGWTVLGGEGGALTFRTPLAHPHNGWVEKFLNTPAFGLEALYLTATGPVPGAKGLTYTATYYDYRAQTGSQHYGSELDLALEWKAAPIHKNLTLGWRFGNYFADRLFTDSLRTSVYAAFTF
jgi:hypothetical protein